MAALLISILSFSIGMLMYVIIFFGLIIYMNTVLDDIDIEFNDDDINDLHEDLNGLRNLRREHD